MRAAVLLARAFTPPPQTWSKYDLYDCVFFLRVAIAILMGIAYGVVGATGLMSFLS